MFQLGDFFAPFLLAVGPIFMNIHGNVLQQSHFSNIADFEGDFLDLQDFLKGLPSSHCAAVDTPFQK